MPASVTAASLPRHALEPGLTALGARHRRVVAQAIGAAKDSPAAIAAVLRDEDALARLVASLDADARGLLTQTAFAAASAWSSGRASIDGGALAELERHGLLFSFQSHWGTTVCTPLELEEPLRRIRVRAHAARVPAADLDDDRAVVLVPEQILHDAATIASLIAAGGVQIKADGELFARAGSRLAAALAPLPLRLPDLAELRRDLALTVLEECGALRVRNLSLPGATAKRELALALDFAELFSGSLAERSALVADALQRARIPGREMLEQLLEALAGRSIALNDLGVAVGAFFLEAGKQPPAPGFGVADEFLGLQAVLERWLRGELGLVVDAGGEPVAAVFIPGQVDEPTGPPCVAQADFELVSLRPPAPGERAALLSVAEPVSGREHVMRITRERVQAAVRAEIDAVARLRSLAGTLPQNVEETVRDWGRQAPRRVRLRSAMMVAAPDEQTADRLALALGATLVERLSPTLLAVDGEDLRAVARAVRQAGVELEDGLDRVSGTWIERPASEAPASWWRPTPPDVSRREPPPGRLVSGLPVPGDAGSGRATSDHAPSAPRADAARELARILAEAGLPASDIEVLVRQTLEEDPDDDEDDEDDEDGELPGEVLLTAYERGCPVLLTYAGASGVRQEWGTVTELDRARIRFREHATGKLSWRWVRSIVGAQLVR